MGGLGRCPLCEREQRQSLTPTVQVQQEGTYDRLRVGQTLVPAQPRTEVSCQPLDPQGEFQAEGPAREKAQSREGWDLAWGGDGRLGL